MDLHHEFSQRGVWGREVKAMLGEREGSKRGKMTSLVRQKGEDNLKKA